MQLALTQLISYNEYNSKIKTDFLLKKLKDGSSIALVSDAGLPVSDPGEHLVKKHVKLVSKLFVPLVHAQL